MYERGCGSMHLMRSDMKCMEGVTWSMEGVT